MFDLRLCVSLHLNKTTNQSKIASLSLSQTLSGPAALTFGHELLNHPIGLPDKRRGRSPCQHIKERLDAVLLDELLEELLCPFCVFGGEQTPTRLWVVPLFPAYRTTVPPLCSSRVLCPPQNVRLILFGHLCRLDRGAVVHLRRRRCCSRPVIFTTTGSMIYLRFSVGTPFSCHGICSSDWHNSRIIRPTSVFVVAISAYRENRLLKNE